MGKVGHPNGDVLGQQQTSGGGGHHAQGQYGDQGVHSGGGGVCLSCLRRLGAMQSLLLIHRGFLFGICLNSWISLIFCYLVWGRLKYKR